jgi:tRNA(adenine34) deaminase
MPAFHPARAARAGRIADKSTKNSGNPQALDRMPAMTDDSFMARALELARRAEEAGEVPIGALVVFQNQIIGEGWNRPIAANDPTAHAEIQAMRSASLSRKNYRLTGAALYVTLEPCDMCVGAMFHARIARAVYGAKDPKKLVLKNQVKLEGGVMADECGAVLSRFFASRR